MHRIYLGRRSPQRVVNEIEAVSTGHPRSFCGDTCGTELIRFPAEDPENVTQEQLSRMLEAGQTFLVPSERKYAETAVAL